MTIHAQALKSPPVFVVDGCNNVVAIYATMQVASEHAREIGFDGV